MEDSSEIDKAYAEGKGSYGKSSLKAAETNASDVDAPTTSKEAESSHTSSVSGIQNVAKGKGKLKGKKGALLAIIVIIIVAVGAVAFISQSFQLVSLFEQIKRDDNKLSATVYTRAEQDTEARLKSTDPEDSLSDFMIAAFKEYGFDYIENNNGDGTVARALVYNGDETSVIASRDVKDSIMSTLSSTGSIVDSYRDVANVATGEDEIAAAWYGALSIPATAAWYDDDIRITYNRLGLDAGKYRNVGNSTDTEEIYEATKKGSVTEGANNTTGTTSRYAWTTHHYIFCSARYYDFFAGEYVCTNKIERTCSDWDGSAAADGGMSTVDLPDGYKVTEKGVNCDTKLSIGDDKIDPKPFSGDEIKTAISTDDEVEDIEKALSNRSVLSAFSTNPKHSNGSDEPSPDHSSRNAVADTKSENSIAAVISGMVKNKSINVAQSMATAVDQTKDGNGGMPMSDWGRKWNTPAEACDADNSNCTYMSSAESSSFNSWFSDNVQVSADNPIVKKYNTALSLDTKNINTDLINNTIMGNYNNIDNTSSNARVAENMSNSTMEADGDDTGELFYYCDESGEGGSYLSSCPSDYSLNPDEYQVSEDVAEYVRAFTGIDLLKDPGGEEGAVAFNLGAFQFNDDALRQSSGTYGGEESTPAFFRMQQDYIAKAANYDRQTKSPFDATSEYTFIGSIYSSILPFLTNTGTNAIFSSLSSVFSVVGSAIGNMTPSASALKDFSYTYSYSSDNCISNESSDMICDVYGQPITIMDLTYMEGSVDHNGTIEYMLSGKFVEEKEGEDGKTTYEITPAKSENEPNLYSEWLLCTNNNSTINNSTSKESNTGGGKKPGFFARIISAIKNFFKGEAKGVRTQSSCGGDYGAKMGIENSADTVEMYKHFAQFTLDQRVRVDAGYADSSASTAYLQQYYEENPLDQSYESVIARLAGVSTEEVIAAIADMEYAVYIAHYDPSTRYQFIDGLFASDTLPEAEEPMDPFATAAIVGKMREFDELRNRASIG